MVKPMIDFLIIMLVHAGLFLSFGPWFITYNNNWSMVYSYMLIHASPYHNNEYWSMVF